MKHIIGVLAPFLTYFIMFLLNLIFDEIFQEVAGALVGGAIITLAVFLFCSLWIVEVIKDNQNENELKEGKNYETNKYELQENRT